MWEIEGGEKSVEIPRNFVPSITFGDQSLRDQLRSNQSSTMINPADNLQSTSERPSQQLLPSHRQLPSSEGPSQHLLPSSEGHFPFSKKLRSFSHRDFFIFIEKSILPAILTFRKIRRNT